MITTPSVKRQAFWTVLILATTFFAVYSTVFSLTHGIYEVYPFLYFLPIILFVYQYPRWGVLFSLFMSTIYLLLVYFISNFDPGFIAVSTAWFVIFVTIGVVTSSFAEGLRAEERKYRGIFENSQAGIFTFDITSERIRELNNKCARMLKYQKEDLIDKDVALILPNGFDRETFIDEIRSLGKTGDTELRFQTRDAVVRHFLISASLSQNNIVICSAIDITERKLAERVIQKAKDELEQRVRERTDELLRSNDALKMEIQERRRFESAIQLANRKLNTLSSITRHDILNQITAIVMYLSLAEEITTEPPVLDHLQKIGQLTELIQAQIRFTKDYQSIGANAPLWQQVSATVKSAIKNLDMGSVRVENELGSLEIYADYLLEKVFFNLVDNSLRHGEKVTMCRFLYQEEEDGITILYEDDGIGIPANAKDKIFRREYYRNTGYGMFLTHEILSITDLTIRETGEPGHGVRFEIHVPAGAFRFAADNKNA
ncbi:ATP-binding protein [uncultured Methanoregula sp.]|uniref:sensor histidine kinase n=1 Tax=uncultured Methanoregula sp. TaxID=1005933 RepID=UPI002AABBC27|nr:ATP-binding protein [uncultured Methanoregula sp.]